MKTIELVDKANPEKVLAYACGDCKLIRIDRETADLCCTPHICETCGKPTGHKHPYYIHNCKVCQSEKRSKEQWNLMLKAETVDIMCDCYYHPDAPNDGYLLDGNTIEDWLDDIYGSELWNELVDLPFVHPTINTGLGLTAYDIVRFVTDYVSNGEFYEDAAEEIVNPNKQEKAAIDSWLLRCEFNNYVPDLKHRVSIAAEIEAIKNNIAEINEE